jgi:tetratricopeptide (TPR) repeat protein
VQAETQRQPVVIHIEDAHWLDEDSQRLLDALTHAVESYPFVILLTCRYGPDGSRFAVEVQAGTPVVNVELQPLAAANVAELAAAMLDGQVDDEMATALQQKSKGNPFFVEALVRDLHDRDGLQQAPAWRIKTGEIRILPDSLREILTAQLDRLTAPVKLLVQQAAVLGDEFALDVLAAMRQGDADLDAKVQQAEAQDIWQRGAQRCVFRHALLREAAYEMQMPADLQQAHRRAAQAIEHVYSGDLPPYYGHLVHHYRAAEDVTHELRYATLAGRHAAQQYPNQDALDYLSRALELTPAAADAARYDLFLTREQVYDRLGRRDEQQADLDALLRLAEQLSDPHKRARAALRRAAFGEATGDLEVLIPYAEQAIQLARASGNREDEANAHIILGKAWLNQGKFTEVQQHFQQALDLAEAAKLEQLQTECLRGLGNVALHRGASFDEALVYFNRALHISEQHQNTADQALTFNALAVAAFHQARYDQAEKWLLQAQAAFMRMNDRRNQARILMNLGALTTMQGRRSEALEYSKHGLALAQEIRDQHNEARLYQNIGNIENYLGEYDSAVIDSEAALKRFEALRNQQGEAQTYINLGLLARYQGRYGDSTAHYRHAADIFQIIDNQRGKEDIVFSLALLKADMGAYEAARAAYLTTLENYRQSGDQNAESDAGICLAQLLNNVGETAAAIQYAEQALALAQSEEIKDRTLQAYAHTALGDAHFASGHLDRAAAHYQIAVDLRQAMQEPHLEVESRAGLARIALVRADAEQMEQQANAIMRRWEAVENFDGTTDALGVYLTCYQILAALGDERAHPMLEAGWDTLYRRLKTISDEPSRQSYQTRVPSHRDLIAAYQQAAQARQRS